jgi:high-affinity nickel-transport protein
MTGWFSILAIGFFLGMRHATDADHVLAVTTIVSKHRSIRHAAAIGIFWGIGHTLTILVVGGGIVLLGWVIPPRVGLSMEFSVGLMLILLGAITVWSALRQTPVVASGSGDIVPHTHRHGDYIHTHPDTPGNRKHPHSPERTPVAWLDRRFGRFAIYRPVRPLLIGMVHGMAGSAAVALLVMAAIRSPAASVLYLTLFGAGTIIGMMLITAVIATPFAVGRRSANVSRGLRIAAGFASLGFGLYLAWEIGIGAGLLY